VDIAVVVDEDNATDKDEDDDEICNISMDVLENIIAWLQ
jgi:hypothetical protein